MRVMVAWFLFLALALPAAAQRPVAPPAPAAPQTPAVPQAVDPADLRALAANYELTNADGDRKCAITLDQKPVGSGYALVYERAACTKLFGFLEEVSAWVPGPAG